MTSLISNADISGMIYYGRELQIAKANSFRRVVYLTKKKIDLRVISHNNMAAPSRQIVMNEKQSKNVQSISHADIVVYHNPSRRKRQRLEEPASSKVATKSIQHQERPTFNLEKARSEVRRLGISGFSGKTKIEAELATLKALGAKIPKNWERRMERKKKHEETQRNRQDLRIGMKSKKKAEPQKKEKTSSKDKGLVDIEIGRYRNGVQYLSKDDIKKVLGSK